MTAQLATLKPAQTAPVLAGTRQIGMTPQSLEAAMEMANLLAKSSMVPKEFIGNPGNIIVAIQWGAEIGLPPLQAMQNLAIINGRPALWGDAVMALVRGSGLLEDFREEVTDQGATCTVKRRGEQPVSRHFSVEDAKKAGLWGKQGPWQQYPKRMLQMRARSWAIRDVFTDVLKGINIKEVLEDDDAKPMGRAEIVPNDQPAITHASRTEEIKAKFNIRKAAQPPHAPVMADGEPVEPPPDLATVLTLIKDAGTQEELNGASEVAKLLVTDKDKKAARDAYRERVKAMKEDIDARRREAEEEARLEREAIQAEASDGAEAEAAADFFRMAGEAA
jgi:hypothetical protein